MVFQIIGSHSFRVSVGDPNFLILIAYEKIVLGRRQELQGGVHIVLIMMKVMLLPLMKGKEKEEED
jgi:hypothetical protein